MQIYNSLSHKKEEFIPNTPGKVSMYTCGPTVYHYAHIGNLRSYIMEDVLEKYLRFTGLDVKRVMNITDVGHLTSDGDTGDDKMLKGAKREHKTVMEIADFYTKAFFADCAELNIKTPDVVEPATHCMCVRRKKENVNRMRILPEGFGWKVLAAMAAAVAGNILVQYVIPWPDFMTVSYEKAAEELGSYPVEVYLLLTLVIAPLLEEGIFRRGIYGAMRRWLGVVPAAFLSAQPSCTFQKNCSHIPRQEAAQKQNHKFPGSSSHDTDQMQVLIKTQPEPLPAISS